MNNTAKNILSLSLISAVIAILLAITNYITEPIIAEQQNAAANAALSEVLPDGGSFTPVDLTAHSLPASVTEVYEAENGGYAVRLTVTGYQPGMTLLIGVKDSAVSGAACISSSETLGYEKSYGQNFIGLDAEAAAKVDTVASATKTTSAYRSAVVDALNTATILGGGSVDIRDEATILRDNLTAALPEGQGLYTPLFLVEDLPGVTAAYTADNGAGTVFAFDESYGNVYVGVKADGTVVGEHTDQLLGYVSEYFLTLAASNTSELDLASFAGLPKALLSASRTDSGNYILTLQAAGFGINGDDWYKPSGEYIILRLSLTEEGRIIACETVSQAESEGFGAACADPKFYSQFNGKEQSNYKDIDAISGATITTNGYTTAIGRAFEALAILKGENAQ